jgi:hypothetical protein
MKSLKIQNVYHIQKIWQDTRGYELLQELFIAARSLGHKSFSTIRHLNYTCLEIRRCFKHAMYIGLHSRVKHVQKETH